MVASRCRLSYGVPCATSPAYQASAINCEPTGLGWQPSLVYVELGVYVAVGSEAHTSTTWMGDAVVLLALAQGGIFAFSASTFASQVLHPLGFAQALSLASEPLVPPQLATVVTSLTRLVTRWQL